jgi:uncharacterized protein (DUF433 family)
MTWSDRIEANGAVLAGKPVVKGTRLAVEFLIELMSHGWTDDQILANYPGITVDDLRACLAYAHDVLKGEKVYPLAAE